MKFLDALPKGECVAQNVQIRSCWFRIAWYQPIAMTGMGQKGDQSLTFAQNKTLAESNSNGVTVHLFEVHQRKVYTYCGVVKLVKEPYPSVQEDATGEKRKVYIFPVRPIAS
ncbi:hypothetical protein [Desulfovibrio piger]